MIKVVLSKDKKEKNVILSVIDEGEGFKDSSANLKKQWISLYSDSDSQDEEGSHLTGGS